MNKSSSLSKDKSFDIENSIVEVNERITLSKNQYEVLNIICKLYEQSISEYIQEALIQTMEYDIQEGDFCDTLMEKIDTDNKGKDNDKSDLMKNDFISGMGNMNL